MDSPGRSRLLAFVFEAVKVTGGDQIKCTPTTPCSPYSVVFEVNWVVRWYLVPKEKGHTPESIHLVAPVIRRA